MRIINHQNSFRVGTWLLLLLLGASTTHAAPAKVHTPSFNDTVDLQNVTNPIFGRQGIDYTRTPHPLDHLSELSAATDPQPLARLRRVAFAIRLESEIRLYRSELSTQRQALLEAVAFYNQLLEHAHRIAARSVRVCAYQLGLPVHRMKSYRVTVAGPLPQTVEGYQLWATQSDPPPCLRDALWSQAEAEKVTRYHHLSRMISDRQWRETPTQQRWAVEREMSELKNELDGSISIQDLKMSAIQERRAQDLLVPLKPIRTVESDKGFPQVPVVPVKNRENE